MVHPVYHLEIRVRRGRVRAKLNEMPLPPVVDEGGGEVFCPPVNPLLVGAGNTLDLDLVATAEGGASVNVALLRFALGEIVGSGAGERVFEEAVTVEGLLPWSGQFHFDNDVVDFSQLLRESPVHADEEALRDYAMHLHALLLAGHVDALAAEMAAKVAAYAQAYATPSASIASSLRQVLSEDIVPAGVRTDFTREEVLLLKRAGGRVWELQRPDGGALIATIPDQEGASRSIPVFVAPHEGRLAVVR